MASLSFFPCTGLSDLPSTSAAPFRRRTLTKKSPFRSHCARAAASPAQENGEKPAQVPQEKSTSSPPATRSKKPVYSMKKGQIVRVDKEKYLNSINYLSVGHPPYFKGLDYIYEDRGEVLDLKIFETGEYALHSIIVLFGHDRTSTIQNPMQIAWVGIPTAPAWLPTDMLIKSEKLNYERM